MRKKNIIIITFITILAILPASFKIPSEPTGASLLASVASDGISSAAAALIFAENKVSPPTRPLTGPGGYDYICSKIISKEYSEDGLKYWIIAPDNTHSDKPFPVIIFNHGWGAINPSFYHAWVEHIVKRGAILIFPQSQNPNTIFALDYTEKAIKASLLAIRQIKNSSLRKIADFDNFAIVGHSIGGVVSANMAALAKNSELPHPKAVMCISPTTATAFTWAWAKIPFEDLSKIPSNTLLLSVIAEDDNLALETDAKQIFSQTTQIPKNNKNLIKIFSDSREETQLIANHIISCDTDTNALDFFGIWKLFDGLTDAAFYNKNRNYALGNTPQQKFMGYWSDGKPVKEMEIITLEKNNPLPPISFFDYFRKIRKN